MLDINGAIINLEGGPYGSILQAAATSRNIAVLALLLEPGRAVRVSMRGAEYGTALIAAVAHGHVEAVFSYGRFGWSVGDLALAIKFVVQTGKALKEAGGAATEYQDAVCFLQGLEFTLRYIQRASYLYSKDTPIACILDQVVRVQRCLASFIDSIQKYEAELGVKRSQGFHHGVWKKVSWATFVSKEVKELQSKVALPISTINANLSLQVMDILSTLRYELAAIQEGIITQASRLREANEVVLQTTIQNLGDKQLASTTTLNRSISNSVEEVKRLQNSGKLSPWIELQEHAVTCVYLFALGLHHLLLKLWLLLGPHFALFILKIPRLSSNLLRLTEGDVIYFEDMLGRPKRLPFEYFQHWEMQLHVTGSINSDYLALGGSYVNKGKYQLMDSNTGQELSRSTWDFHIRQDSQVEMSAIQAVLPGEEGSCPRCCKVYPRRLRWGLKRFVCSGCGLISHANTFGGVIKYHNEIVTTLREVIDASNEFIAPRPTDLFVVSQESTTIRQGGSRHGADDIAFFKRVVTFTSYDALFWLERVQSLCSRIIAKAESSLKKLPPDSNFDKKQFAGIGNSEGIGIFRDYQDLSKALHPIYAALNDALQIKSASRQSELVLHIWSLGGVALYLGACLDDSILDVKHTIAAELDVSVRELVLKFLVGENYVEQHDWKFLRDITSQGRVTKLQLEIIAPIRVKTLSNTYNIRVNIAGLVSAVKDEILPHLQMKWPIKGVQDIRLVYNGFLLEDPKSLLDLGI
ncbi:hypothetical protein MMC13_004345 [Lambiella insularis]|nr:hypothetical protein [Lambiella insularis]